MDNINDDEDETTPQFFNGETTWKCEIVDDRFNFDDTWYVIEKDTQGDYDYVRYADAKDNKLIQIYVTEEGYAEYNPWNLQTRQGSIWDFIIYIPLFFILTMSWKGRFHRYYFNISIMLIVFIMVSLIHQMYDLNVWNLFHTYYDITYFNNALPFLMLYISGTTKRTSLVTR
jgi:hypothetical protein